MENTLWRLFESAAIRGRVEKPFPHTNEIIHTCRGCFYYTVITWDLILILSKQFDSLLGGENLQLVCMRVQPELVDIVLRLLDLGSSVLWGGWAIIQ
jgi:hypothetical protein